MMASRGQLQSAFGNLVGVSGFLAATALACRLEAAGVEGGIDQARAYLPSVLARADELARPYSVQLAFEPLHPMVCGFRSIVSSLDEALDLQKKEQLFEQTPYVVYDNRIEDNALNFSIHNITEVFPVDPTIGTRSWDDPMADLKYPKTAKVMGIDGKEYRIRGFRRASYGLPMIERQEMQRLLSSVYKRDK